jgi:hypothetical protein
MRRTDPSRRLVRALERAGLAASVKIAWTLTASVPWASALFMGERHVLLGAAEATPALDAFLAALPEMDLPLPDGCVADLVVEGRRAITLRALVIDAC